MEVEKADIQRLHDKLDQLNDKVGDRLNENEKQIERINGVLNQHVPLLASTSEDVRILNVFRNRLSGIFIGISMCVGVVSSAMTIFVQWLFSRVL